MAVMYHILLGLS